MNCKELARPTSESDEVGRLSGAESAESPACTKPGNVTDKTKTHGYWGSRRRRKRGAYRPRSSRADSDWDGGGDGSGERYGS